MSNLRYPIGEQDFAKIRNENRVYIDKTDILYRLVTDGSYYFLSRPRRFGKSLMLSTLRYYFEGRRELFQGLAMERLEHDWTVHPVIYLDMSSDKYADVANLHSVINRLLSKYERLYNVQVNEDDTYGVRLGDIIEAAHQMTGQLAVVLIDEYDAPLLDSTHNEDQLTMMRNITRSLYSPLKAQAAHLRFVMLTGITKFSQLSIFSELNNLTNISMLPDYEAICGITEQEMLTQLRPGIEEMAQSHGCTYDECASRLKEYYDGYHFGRRLTDIYNPFSLLSALANKEFGLHWFGHGTPTWLLDKIKEYGKELPDLEEIHAIETQFDQPTERITDIIPVLYQSGYLTIKDYDRDFGDYILGIPNHEVRMGLGQSLVKYQNLWTGDGNTFLRRAYIKLTRGGDLAEFMSMLTDFFRAIPYDISNDNERHFQAVFYAVLASFGADIMAEDRTSNGRADIVLRMPRDIYVVELKYGRSVDEAMAQLHRKDYAAKWRGDSRAIHLLGMNIDPVTRTIDAWRCE